MGKLHLAAAIGIFFVLTGAQIDIDFYRPEVFDIWIFIMSALAPTIFLAFALYRVFMLKKHSDLYFCRSTRRIIYKRFKRTYTLDWNRVEGGIYSFTVFTGKATLPNYALALAERRDDGSIDLRDGFWVESNEPTHPSANYVAEVWEYIRQFMDEGPEKLPPVETSWFLSPLHHAFLTPEQAWRHYVPWRTGEPGELQGKRIWMLPFWLVLFPYNITLALSWYGLCRLCGVKQFSPTLPEVDGNAKEQS